ncbi:MULTISPECIES: response regulator [unclassified Massilia]|uniref:response regulator n=1 Tax=unclassified Massilia TaxID=2609279 RepID=UPI0009E9F2CC|nr:MULTISPECIES: response regulator [unclassified Massilia]
MQISSDGPSSGKAQQLPVGSGEGDAVSGALLGKLLLVDDEPDGADSAATLFRMHGLQVKVVHSAAEALQALQDDKEIGAVLTDIMMPGMTGLELAEAVRHMYPTVKIVLVSGYVLPELLKDRERNYLFVEKPYRIDTMMKVLCS